jgi:ferritin-like protein
MSSEAYHEPIDLISERTKDLHRAIVSLIEELEAIDWYTQRAEACGDDELRGVLIHHRNEEIEHAMMNLEWLRRNSPEFDARARTYLFGEGPILALEARAEAKAPAVPPANGALGIGSLRRT